MAPADPDVSVVVPALNEQRRLGATLESVRNLDTDYAVEVLVVDGGSSDDTRKIAREWGARVLAQTGTGIGAARDQGAREARGAWLAFVDADTRLRRAYLTAMLGLLEAEGLAAGSSRCRVTGPLRARAVEATINHVFPHLHHPILPGFNFVIRRETYESTGGFPSVPNEDTAFSRALAREVPTGYCPRVLVETSGRRVATRGLTGTLWYYLRLDAARVRSGHRSVLDSTATGERREG